MINTFINGYKFSFAEGANHFIYFLTRLPLVGKHIPESLYRETLAKLVLGILKELFSTIFMIFKKALYLGVMVLLPAIWISGEGVNPGPVYIHILFFLSFLLGPVIRDIFMDETDKKGFSMISLMREDPKKYYLSELIFRNALDFFCFLLPIILIGLLAELSALKSIILLVELIAFRFIVEGIVLFVWEKTKKDRSDLATGMLILIGVLLAYAMPVMVGPINFQGILFNIFFLIGVIALAIVAFLYMFRYKKYKRLAKTVITKENVFKLQATMKSLQFADVQINDKKINAEDLKNKLFEKKTGYEYLNSLFFHRHKRIVAKPMKWRLYIIALIFLLAAIALLYAPISEAHKEKLLGLLPNSTPIFVFGMYLMSTGERICKAMFYNCDVSLLRYGYYRDPKVILSNFTSRIKKVVTLNVIPALAICLALTGVFVICGGASRLMTMVPLFLCIICLAAFFSIHHLFMYYVIQPYTAELTIKSPAFSLVNVIMSMVCYSCSTINISSYYFTLGVLILTVVYMLVALAITYKLAPKTFRLK